MCCTCVKLKTSYMRGALRGEFSLSRLLTKMLKYLYSNTCVLHRLLLWWLAARQLTNGHVKCSTKHNLFNNALLSSLSLILPITHYMHVYTHTYTHARTHAHTHTHTHARTHARTHTRTGISVRAMGL